MLRTRFLLILACLCTGLDVIAQCGTDEMLKIAMQKDPDLKQRQAEMNSAAAAYSKQPQSRAAIFTIPVVFHVLHTGGSENISRAQIMDQIRILNNDYQLKNWNKSKIRSQFTSRAADCQIQFKLASIDPNGNCTDGINRIYTPMGVEVDQNTEEFKSLSYWNSTKYLNIWVVTSIKSSSGVGTTLGYAYFPWMTPTNKNGVVVRADRIGSIEYAASSADSGRTLTHEVGHWLGLYHTFEGDCFGQGDFCDDTPPVTGTFTNANCPANGNSCTNDSPDLPDLWEDYMDYSDGKCMAMFTANQKSFMHYYLGKSPRSTIVSASNLIATGVTLSTTSPVANFTSSQRIVCAGSPVNFYDISCKAAVTGRSWTFTGSSTPSSSAQNPVVTYQTAGQYKVSLLVQNGSGSNTKTVDNYITVISPSSAQYPNLEETFENGDPAGHGYRSVSPRPWEWDASTGYTGTHCFKAPVKTTDTIGSVYSFVTPPVDLTKLASKTSRLTFYAGYAQRTTGASETLRVLVSTDCGNSFTQIYERSTTGLMYNGGSAAADFVPSQSSHWKRLGLTSLTSYTTYNAVIFRFDVVSAAGNPVYLDNINISEWYAGTEAITKDKIGVNIYPNPVQDKANVEIEVAQNTAGTVELFDMAGRKVLDIYQGNFTKGLNTITFNNPGLQNGSLFLVKITTADGQISKAVTFAP